MTDRPTFPTLGDVPSPSDYAASLRVAADRVSQDVQDSARGLARRIGPLVDRARERTRDSARQVDAYAHDHLWTVVAVAALAGAAASWFMAARRR